MRRRRTKAAVEQLEVQILDVLRDDHPQSVRHVFYRMTDPRLPEPVEKSDQGYAQVQHRIAELRRRGVLPYRWITDATRRGYHVNTFRDAADFLRQMNALYRADMWSDADDYVEVWCESRSIAGVIEDDCRELGVSLYPSGGFTSITLAFQAAEYIRSEIDNTDKTSANVIYIGDYDQAGVLIDQDIERKLRHHLGDDFPLEFVRIAINEDQIDEYDLPTKPRKAGDKRSRQVAATVEAEAMPAAILRGLLRDAIEAFLPPRALEVAKVAEENERLGMDLLAGHLDAMGLSGTVDMLDEVAP
jgi:hypothetical protein